MGIFNKLADALMPKELAGIAQIAAPFLPPQIGVPLAALGSAKKEGKVNPYAIALAAAPGLSQKFGLGRIPGTPELTKMFEPGSLQISDAFKQSLPSLSQFRSSGSSGAGESLRTDGPGRSFRDFGLKPGPDNPDLVSSMAELWKKTFMRPEDHGGGLDIGKMVGVAGIPLSVMAYQEQKRAEDEYNRQVKERERREDEQHDKYLSRYMGFFGDEPADYMLRARNGGIMGLQMGGSPGGPIDIGESLELEYDMSPGQVQEMDPYQRMMKYLGRAPLARGGDPDDPAWGPPEITEGELLDFEETPPDLLEEEVMRETIETPEGSETIEMAMSDGPIPGQESEEFLRYYKFFIQLGFSPEEAEEKAWKALAQETEQVAMAPDPSEFNPLEQLMQQLEQQETPGQEPGMMEETETLGLEDILAKGGRPGYEGGGSGGDYVNAGGNLIYIPEGSIGKFGLKDRIYYNKQGHAFTREEIIPYLNPGGASYANGGRPGGDDEIDILTEEWGNLDADQRAGYGDIETFRQSDHFKIILDNLRFKSAKGGRPGYARGSGIASIPKGHDFDLRDSGGFIPYGSKERADDVPARVSKNEFVMTADAVRAAGGGSVNKGAQRMYNLMNNLEARV